jgi:serine/threonine protein kinase
MNLRPPSADIPNAMPPAPPAPPTPPAPPRLSLMQPTKKPLQQILNNYFNSLSDEIKALQHNELPVPDPEQNLPSGAFGYAYKSGNRVVKIINLIKYEYYTEDKVIQNLNNEIVNYYDITKLCPNYFCKFVGYYYGINEGSYKLAIIMEYCGMDLFEYINLLYTLNRKPNKNDLSNYTETFKTIFIQIADALKCLHSKNYVHFDLKFENITVIRNDDNTINKVKLIDAGSLTKVSENHNYYPYGTKEYMAPEIWKSMNSLDPLLKNDPRPSDVFSYGRMLQYLTLYNIHILEDAIINKLIDDDPNIRPKINEINLNQEQLNIEQYFGGKGTESSRLDTFAKGTFAKKSKHRSRRQKKRQTRR